VAETTDFKAEPPAGIDPTEASGEEAPVYEIIRGAIIEGSLAANERVVVQISTAATALRPIRCGAG
jgi:DNA-binding GntR family transcriptional regulator